MGKRIISQARGKGSLTYQVRKQAYRYKVKYPTHDGSASIIKILHSPAHSAPLIRAKIGNEIFYNVATAGIVEGNQFNIGSGEAKSGNVMTLSNIPLGTSVCNVERNPGDGGKMIRAAGTSATVIKRYDHNKVGVLMPNKHELQIDGSCRATIGVVAGEGRGLKPFLKAGAVHYKMKARNKLWPRTSAVKMNAIDHPFGSGRGKRIKPKIARRDAPAGARVGHLRPRRTGGRN